MLLGDNYEAARLKFKNPHGPPSKGAAKKPISKSKAKRKKVDDDDNDNDGDGDDDEGKPAKRSRKPVSRSKGKAKKEGDDEEDVEDDEEDEPAPTTKNVPELLLANKWDLDTGLDPVGWWISEKLDGVRCAGFPDRLHLESTKH